MAPIIWHNPRCSKSRQTLALLEERNLNPTVRLYLVEAPTVAEITDVLAKLGVSPRELMRKGEQEYKDLGLKDVSDDKELIAAMADMPKLIERPVVLLDDKAALGRPPESVLDLF